MKNLQLKHINNNLFLLDLDAEIKKDDYLYDDLTSSYAGIHQHSGVEYDNGNLPNIIQAVSGTTCPKRCSQKVIGQLNPELPNIPLFTLPVKPQVDVEKLLQKKYPYGSGNSLEKREAYKEALSDNADKKFTKEDIELAVILARKTPEISLNDIVICCERTQPNLQEFDGKFVEIEMEKEFTGYNEHKLPFIPKLTNEKITITNIL